MNRKQYLDANYSVEQFQDDKLYFGWYKEYYCIEGTKVQFLGTVRVEQPDREYVGYNGKKIESIAHPSLKKAKKVRKGTEVYSLLFPLCV